MQRSGLNPALGLVTFCLGLLAAVLLITPRGQEPQFGNANGVARQQMLHTQVNIMAGDSAYRKGQNDNVVGSYMGGVAMPIPAGKHYTSFPYPKAKPSPPKIDTSKFVMRSEDDDRFKQVESRLKVDEKTILGMKKTIHNLKKKLAAKK